MVFFFRFSKEIHLNNIFKRIPSIFLSSIQEEKAREYRRELKKEKRSKRHDDGGGDDMDPAMAALMGFSGFGSSSKKS